MLKCLPAISDSSLLLAQYFQRLSYQLVADPIDLPYPFNLRTSFHQLAGNQFRQGMLGARTCRAGAAEPYLDDGVGRYFKQFDITLISA